MKKETRPSSKEKKGAEMELERRAITATELRIQKDDDKPTKLIGYAAVFNKLSEPIFGFREKIAPGAFTKSLAAGDDVRALFNHNPNQLLARRSADTLKLEENKKGLRTEIELPDTTLGNDIAVMVERGDLTQMSFGFLTVSDEWNVEGGKDIRTLKEVKLIDVSPATFPAYPDATIAVRSHERWQQGQKQENSETEQTGKDAMQMRLRLAEAS